MGDPAGCGPQITIGAWQAKSPESHPFFVIGDPRLYEPHVAVKTIDSPHDALASFSDALPVLPIEIADYEALTVGSPSGAFAAATIESIELACANCLSGAAAAMVTNPISKAVLYEQGFQFPGHTEFIADLCQTDAFPSLKPVMMLVGGGLRVALASIHVPLMQVLEHLTPQTLRETATITHRALQQNFGMTRPRLAFTGLNPHAGENGTIGIEERDLINPVAEQLRSQGVEISDARPADTVFHEALNGQYDAVIAMTHDQGLIPVKTLDMWGGVNTTLGLPITRTSPDHGTAYDAAAAGTCRPDSLIAALELASECVIHRARANA